MRKVSIALALGVMAGLGSGVFGMPSIKAHQPVVQTSPRPAFKRRSNGFASYWNYNNGPGWTADHVQHMAKKRRNKARHKAACKGR